MMDIMIFCRDFYLFFYFYFIYLTLNKEKSKNHNIKHNLSIEKPKSQNWE